MEDLDDLFDDTQDQISLEDALLAIEILKKALEFRPYIREAIVGEKFLNLSSEAQIKETLTPRVAFSFADPHRTIPILFFRFVSEEAPVLEAFFYPIESILLFLNEARRIVNLYSPPNRTDKEKKDLVFDHTLDMTLLLIDNFYRRAEITMNFIPDEIIRQWHLNKKQQIMHSQSERGDKPPKSKDTYFDNLMNNYRKNISQFWKYQGQTRDNWRKLGLAEEYEDLYKHWSWLLKMSGDPKSSWREYAKAGKYKDTPDDLLEKLKDVDRSTNETTKNRISELALEHSARRVGLIKKTGVSEFARNKRRQGIKVSDYSSQQLFIFLKEGRALKIQIEENEKIIAQVETEPNFEQVSESALMKKAKLLEQKIHFIQEKTENQLEQKINSTKVEN
jgi:hypothetical protein